MCTILTIFMQMQRLTDRERVEQSVSRAKYILCATYSRIQQLTVTRNMQGSSPMGRHEPLRYGLGICPVSAWLARLATMSSSIWDRVRSCIRANLGAEQDARSPFTIFVSSHSLELRKCVKEFLVQQSKTTKQPNKTHLNIGPFSNTDCSQRYGLQAPTSSRVTTDTSYRVGFRLIRADTRTCNETKEKSYCTQERSSFKGDAWQLVPRGVPSGASLKLALVISSTKLQPTFISPSFLPHMDNMDVLISLTSYTTTTSVRRFVGHPLWNNPFRSVSCRRHRRR